MAHSFHEFVVLADVKELISILADSEEECSVMGTYRNDRADSLCPPRVRAMLASRACKSSVVVGDPLDRNEMQKVFWFILPFLKVCSYHDILDVILSAYVSSKRNKRNHSLCFVLQQFSSLI